MRRPRSLHGFFWAATALAAVALLALAPGAPALAAAGGTLRIITWADYVPADVAAQFTQETGIKVEVTLSNNEEMISKLRATRGAGFDLAQPSQDRILGPQQEFGIYKPIDLTKVQRRAHPARPSRDRAPQRHGRRQALRAAVCLGCRGSGGQHAAHQDQPITSTSVAPT